MVLAVMAPSLKARSKLMFFPDSRTACTMPSTSTHWPSSAPVSNSVKLSLGAARRQRGPPNHVRLGALNDGSIIPCGTYARYLNQVARLERKRRHRHIDRARSVGGKKRRSPRIDVQVVVGDYGGQMYGIVPRRLFDRQTVDVVGLGEGR